MSLNLKDYHNKLLFIPLGGANEIGINVNLYYFQGKFIMIDCGAGFADEELPGVDIILADLSFIEKHRDKLLGIILTHAHEDHLGGIQYLWETLRCDIYATKFTKTFLEKKISEYSFSDQIKIHEVDTSKKIDLSPFSIEMINMTHSAPEMQALMIRTEAGNIIHTGDWKFDSDPVIGELSNTEALANCAKEGVLALVCDSTNVFQKGTSGSEGGVQKTLIDVISGCPEMVIVTTFASNVARLNSIIHAAKVNGRKVVIVGRSLHRIIEAAVESNYLKDIDTFVEERSIFKYKRKELLVISTGCQAEPKAAMAKIANHSHPYIKIGKGDTVIFSSKIIPGNDKRIFKLLNTLVRQKVEVVTQMDKNVHVSGHPCIDELKEMYDLVKPHISVPVHGESIHIHKHVKVAKSYGIPHAIAVKNGSVVLLEKTAPKIIGHVDSGYLAVDGNYLLPCDASVLKMRRNMMNAGLIIAHITTDASYKVIRQPVISTPGLLDPAEDSELIDTIKDSIMRTLNEQRKVSGKSLNIDKIASVVKKLLKKTIKNELNKSPCIIVNIDPE